MRGVWVALAGASVLIAGGANAADKPVIGPAPSWVRPVAPSVMGKPDGAAIRVLLSDQQVSMEPGRETVYSEFAIKIQTPQGLSAGNLSLPWRPDTDTLTVHKLRIRRGDQVIDVLGSGQTFSVLRRETNLESAMLDGVLTANIQPEGLQVGDVLELAASITSSDPVMKGHVEVAAATWNDASIARAHLSVRWPSGVPVKLRQTTALAPLKPIKTGSVTQVELSLDDVKPYPFPKGAPPRYRAGRLIELTDFASWAELAALLAPLYQTAAVLPAQGPLRLELDRIRGATSDPKARTEAALALVQDRIRYVALAMGAGGLVPADAQTTWSRRYGDCKAKTALLLGLLHALDVPAEAVAVNAISGDGLDARLPRVGLFNHVLVRATIAGKSYWLDGTRTGDTSLDRLATPAFGWGLPLLATGATLVRIAPGPLAMPSQEVSIRIDARAGVTVPAPVRIITVLRGDEAIGTNLAMSNLAGDTRDRALREYWHNQYDFIEPKTTSADYDAKIGELRLVMDGIARMDWSSGWYETDGTAVGYKADFSREPGPDGDAPFAVPFPYFIKTTETILLPPGFDGMTSDAKHDIDQTVAGIAYHRHSSVAASVFTIEKTERSVAPEFTSKEAPAAQVALRQLADQTVYLRRPANYQMTQGELTASMSTTPATAQGFIERGWALLDGKRYGDALADFEHAVGLEPKNAVALAGRGLTHVWRDEFDAATKDLDAAAVIEPRMAIVFRARGLMAQKREAPREAIAAYTTALDIEPDGAFALGHRAEADRAAGDQEAALRDAAAALKRDPHWVDLYLMRGNILRNQGKNEAVLAEAAAVASANPGNSFAQVVAGNLYGAMHDDADAMRAYDRALAIEPEAYIYLNRGRYRPRTDLAGRRADIDAALKLEPKLEEALAAKADMQADAGDFAAAGSTYTEALKATPGALGLLLGRGIVFARAGDTLHADQDFAAARAKATTPGELNHLCWTKATHGVGLISALAECDAAIAKQPDSSPLLDSRGFVLLRLGRYDASIAAYDAALARNANQAASLFGRAVAWARKGDKTKSDADAIAASKLNPDVRSEFGSYGVSL